jgi:hypothetical protein
VLDSEGRTFRIYLNGVEDGSRTIPGMSTQASNCNVGIGTAFNTSTISDGAFKGLIDDVVILNRALSSGEMLDCYRLREGLWYWRANVTDGTNQDDTGIQSFRVGMVYSTVNLLSPVNNTNVTSIPATFEFNASDNDGLVNATLYLGTETITLVEQTVAAA